MTDDNAQDSKRLVSAALESVRLYAAKNPDMTAPQALDMFERAYDVLQQASATSDVQAKTKRKPAVPISESVAPDGSYVVCLHDGQRMVALKRYIKRVYNLTPEQYREYWGLPDDHPLTAPAYTDSRRAMAVMHGLGHHPRERNSEELAKAEPEEAPCQDPFF